MDLIKQNCCQNCGGDLYQLSDGRWKCRYCSGEYNDQSVEKQVASLKQQFDEIKLEAIANLRGNLYQAVTAKYISNDRIKEICAEIKNYLPDDFLASFYMVATGNNDSELTDYILKMDVESNYDLMSSVIRFLLKSPHPGYMLALSDLIDRTYKGRDLVKYEEFATIFSEENEKVNTGVYETGLPRDVFVAY